MGGGSYSYNSAVSRSVDKGYATESVASSTGADMSRYKRKMIHDVFTQRQVHQEMRSVGIQVRESRDSEEHPNSLAIIIALDVTGSMGQVPHQLLAEGFPKLMDKIIQAGVRDPQVMFLAIGDHNYDTAPLQVGQFESSDELLEKWLTSMFLEGGGGGNAGESYPLAWYFAANHTSIDCWEKRKQKGILFTIGDEPPLMDFPREALQEIMGEGSQAGDEVARKLLERAQETYEVFHIHIHETPRGRQPDSMERWGALLDKGSLLTSQHHDDVADTIANKILEVQGKLDPLGPKQGRGVHKNADGEIEEDKKKPAGNDVEMM